MAIINHAVFGQNKKAEKAFYFIQDFDPHSHFHLISLLLLVAITIQYNNEWQLF